jgi:hypothetical protein
LGLPLVLPLAVVLVRRRSPAALAVLVIALVFILQPFRWWSRFTIQLAALGAVAIVAAAVWAPRRWMRRTVRVAALTLTVAGVVLSSYEVDPAARARALPAGDLLWLIGQPDERTLGKLFFPEYRFLEDMPEDATVIVDLEAKPVRFVYPFFGASHGRRVLPAGEGVPPAGAWVITGAGRPLDRRLVERDDFKLVSDVRGLRAWRPRP